MKNVVGERNQSLRCGSTQQGPAPHGSYPHPAKVQGPDFASIRRRALRAGVADRVQHVPNRGHGSSGETPNSAILADQDEGALAGMRIGAVLRPAVLVAFTDRATQHEIAQPRSGYRLASAAAEIEMDELARQTRLIGAIAHGGPEHVELPQLGIPSLCQQWERRTGRKDSSRAGFLDADDGGTEARDPDGGNCFLKVGEGL
jgi:hypothetical protein